MTDNIIQFHKNKIANLPKKEACILVKEEAFWEALSAYSYLTTTLKEATLFDRIFKWKDLMKKW